MPPLRKTSQLLELRSLAHVAVGYFLGPVAGLTVLWLLWIAPTGHWQSALTIWVFMIILGGLACFAVELVIITPLLLGYRRYGWWWLNGWTAVVIAFAVGVSCSLILDLLDAVHHSRGYSEWGQYGVALTINGEKTVAGWNGWRNALGPHAMAAGMVGGISALVFRLVAIRARPTSKTTLT